MKSKGMVYLVGAGPGDAGLLTLRGAEVLARAEVVLYDVLVNPELVRLAPATAERLCRGSLSTPGQAMPQADMNAVMVERAREGKIVVRLKGGDPYIFGRGAEEAEALAAAHIPFEVVPGVSSITAGPCYAGIPLTHRAHCSSFTVLTGHGDPDGPEVGADLERIADIPGTKIVLMGMKRMRALTRALTERGMSQDTPVAVVRWATTGRQQSVAGTLATITDLVETVKIQPPAITIIGEVVKLRNKLNWFEHRPLFGQRVVVTRAREQAGELAHRLAELGADLLEIPTIKIAAPDDKVSLVEAMESIGEYDWLVFTSVNGVTSFFNYFFKAFGDLRCIGGVRIAAVGPGTAARLEALHLKVDVVPKEALGRQIAQAIAAFESVENLKILLPRAQRANRDLPQALEEMGAIVDDVACYQTVLETDDQNGAAARLVAEGADWIIFTSGSTVENLHARVDLQQLLGKFPALKLASIGPETSKAITALGLKPAIEARRHTVAGLIQSLLAAQHAR